MEFLKHRRYRHPADRDARITGWSIDTRTIAPGDLFFALRGPNHDGNAYVDEALRKGACGGCRQRECEP